MKNILLLIMLLISFLLTSCKENTNNNESHNNNAVSGEQQENSPKTERLSYQEYIAKYGDLINNKETNGENAYNTGNNETEKQYNTNEEINLLATYSTPLKDDSEGRVNNLEIVCERLDNYILNPEETFSYNDVTGPYGPSDGFEEATILLSDGTKEEGYGGGVCQLSSTLYNVVKQINNLEITERHHHSEPVAYVPKGEDATISLQSNLDFKFVNHAGYPIRFKAKCEGNQVTVWAYKE